VSICVHLWFLIWLRLEPAFGLFPLEIMLRGRAAYFVVHTSAAAAALEVFRDLQFNKHLVRQTGDRVGDHVEGRIGGIGSRFIHTAG